MQPYAYSSVRVGGGGGEQLGHEPMPNFLVFIVHKYTPYNRLINLYLKFNTNEKKEMNCLTFSLKGALTCT